MEMMLLSGPQASTSISQLISAGFAFLAKKLVIIQFERFIVNYKFQFAWYTTPLF